MIRKENGEMHEHQDGQASQYDGKLLAQLLVAGPMGGGAQEYEEIEAALNRRPEHGGQVHGEQDDVPSYGHHVDHEFQLRFLVRGPPLLHVLVLLDVRFGRQLPEHQEPGYRGDQHQDLGREPGRGGRRRDVVHPHEAHVTQHLFQEVAVLQRGVD